MTPKEKADELIRKYYSIGAIEVKQCALIAVDEMANYFSKETFMMAYPEIAISELKYWQEVKQEIEKL
jgi:hypothetical protein